ncbi:hypothetical protein ED312_18155 [Sinomicrobium pectinilyticum]|uniref:Uncharacterized protein n=1 Tax=Sinomicrobium pectinilyticum TaxID=1084421 RepID=A0A3N0E212_SINP1|nr:hypothetical protein [Sinomicrobium pectinilyticum]RNL81894.1 hypothetical protein ED312_18155 [Sinomicrobium pectinilyticum]
MDIISLEMGIAFLFIFLAPIVYILAKENAKKKKLNNRVTKICSDNAIKKTNTISIANHIFVSDIEGKKLLNYHKKQDNFSVMDLEDFDTCSIQRSWNNGESSKVVLQKVSMVFTPKGQGSPHVISLFDDSYENPLEAEAILYEADRFTRYLNTEALH